MDTKNRKCLYFLGKANLELEKYTDAIQAFKTLLELEPQNEEAKKGIAIANSRYKSDIN